jgi:hypothetical protein
MPHLQVDAYDDSTVNGDWHYTLTLWSQQVANTRTINSAADRAPLPCPQNAHSAAPDGGLARFAGGG